MIAQQTSLRDDYPIQSRGRNAILLSLFFVLLVVRLAASLGEAMHYDEPFWMVRGDFLIRSLIEGNLEDLQNNHWMLAPMEGERRIFNSYIATGSGTAFLTGLGRLFIPLAPGGEGIGGLVAELFFSRLLHVLCSALTPLLLLLLARRLGLPWMGQIALLSYFTFDPILQEMGSLAHLESFLTLTVPVALLLFGVSHLQQSLPLCLVAGAVFGLAFVNRINGGVVAVAALAYIVLRLLLQRHASQSVRSLLWREGVRLGLLCLVGWAVFVLCFPPLWRSPVFGFTDFLYQQAALTGSGADFEAAAVFLWTDSGLRFLFVLFGLAGSCTVAYALDRWGPHSAKVARLVAGTILVLSMWAATSIVIRQQDSLRRTRDFYGKLHARNFSRIDVPRFPASYIRTDADPGGPALRIATGSTHTRLFYLGVLLTDGRRFREVKPGWVRAPPGEKIGMREGGLENGKAFQAPPNAQSCHPPPRSRCLALRGIAFQLPRWRAHPVAGKVVERRAHQDSRLCHLGGGTGHLRDRPGSRKETEPSRNVQRQER